MTYPDRCGIISPNPTTRTDVTRHFVKPLANNNASSPNRIIPIRSTAAKMRTPFFPWGGYVVAAC